MIKNHELDAPEDFKGEYDTAPADHSELSGIYFTPKQETRPLIMSDDERHKLHDARRMRQNTQLHHHILSLTVSFAGPLIILAFIAITGFAIIRPGSEPMIVPIIILLGLIWYGLSQWAFGKFTRRLYSHNIKASLFIGMLVAIIAVTSPLIIWVAQLAGQNIFLQAAVGAGAGFIITALAIKILVCIATRSWHASPQSQ